MKHIVVTISVVSQSKHVKDGTSKCYREDWKIGSLGRKLSAVPFRLYVKIQIPIRFINKGIKETLDIFI